MANGVPKKRQLDEQRRKKRAQAARMWPPAAKTPPKAINPGRETAVWRR